MIQKLILSLFLLALGTSAVVEANSYTAADFENKGAIICGEEIDLDTVKRLYLGQQRDLIAVNLPEGDSTRVRFENEIIGRSPAQLKAHWSRLVFTGRAWDLAVYQTDAEVLRFVSNSKNGIGYVRDASVVRNQSGVYIVALF